MTALSWVQHDFRFRNDDGNEANATWIADAKITVSQYRNIRFRLRIAIDQINNVAWTNNNFNLYYSINAGTYVAVTGSTPIQFSLSANFADGDNCTQQLQNGSNGSFLVNNSGMKESTGGVTNSSAANRDYFETEWSLVIDSAQVAIGDTIDLRVYNGSTALGTYSETPRVTASEPSNIVLNIISSA